MLSRVPQLFLILSSIYATIGLLGICLVFDYKPISENDTSVATTDTSLDSHSYIIDSEVLVRDPNPTPLIPSYSIRKALGSRYFSILWLTFAFNTQTVFFVTGMMKAFGSSSISDDHYLAIVLSLCYVIAGIGSVFWGKVLDYLKFRVSKATV